MVGRIVRLLVGLVVLIVAADVWRPSSIPHGISVHLGAFEDLRVALAVVLGLVGVAFVLAAAFPPTETKRRRQPMSM